LVKRIAITLANEAKTNGEEVHARGQEAVRRAADVLKVEDQDR